MSSIEKRGPLQRLARVRSKARRRSSHNKSNLSLKFVLLLGGDSEAEECVRIQAISTDLEKKYGAKLSVIPVVEEEPISNQDLEAVVNADIVIAEISDLLARAEIFYVLGLREGIGNSETILVFNDAEGLVSEIQAQTPGFWTLGYVLKEQGADDDEHAIVDAMVPEDDMEEGEDKEGASMTYRPLSEHLNNIFVAAVPTGRQDLMQEKAFRDFIAAAEDGEQLSPLRDAFVAAALSNNLSTAPMSSSTANGPVHGKPIGVEVWPVNVKTFGILLNGYRRLGEWQIAGDLCRTLANMDRLWNVKTRRRFATILCVLAADHDDTLLTATSASIASPSLRASQDKIESIPSTPGTPGLDAVPDLSSNVPLAGGEAQQILEDILTLPKYAEELDEEQRLKTLRDLIFVLVKTYIDSNYTLFNCLRRGVECATEAFGLEPSGETAVNLAILLRMNNEDFSTSPLMQRLVPSLYLTIGRGKRRQEALVSNPDIGNGVLLDGGTASTVQSVGTLLKTYALGENWDAVSQCVRNLLSLNPGIHQVLNLVQFMELIVSCRDSSDLPRVREFDFWTEFLSRRCAVHGSRDKGVQGSLEDFQVRSTDEAERMLRREAEAEEHRHREETTGFEIFPRELSAPSLGPETQSATTIDSTLPNDQRRSAAATDAHAAAMAKKRIQSMRIFPVLEGTGGDAELAYLQIHDDGTLSLWTLSERMHIDLDFESIRQISVVADRSPSVYMFVDSVADVFHITFPSVQERKLFDAVIAKSANNAVLYRDEAMRMADEENMQFRWTAETKHGIEILGNGSFGVVYAAINLETGAALAVKEVTILEGKDFQVQALKDEITLLRSLKHRHIVRYLNSEVSGDVLRIFMERVSGGSIAALILKWGALDEGVVSRYTGQICLGLQYLHDCGIVHRDVKGSNILVTHDGIIKITDFGCSTRLAQMHEGSREMIGTVQYMAPEVITAGGRGYGPPADVWSLGCTVIEMLIGHPPWSNYNNVEAIMYEIGMEKKHPPLPDSASQESISFLSLCFRSDPRMRFTVERLLCHPFASAVPPGTSPMSPLGTVGARGVSMVGISSQSSTPGHMARASTSFAGGISTMSQSRTPATEEALRRHSAEESKRKTTRAELPGDWTRSDTLPEPLKGKNEQAAVPGEDEEERYLASVAEKDEAEEDLTPRMTKAYGMGDQVITPPRKSTVAVQEESPGKSSNKSKSKEHARGRAETVSSGRGAADRRKAEVIRKWQKGMGLAKGLISPFKNVLNMESNRDSEISSGASSPAPLLTPDEGRDSLDAKTGMPLIKATESTPRSMRDSSDSIASAATATSKDSRSQISNAERFAHAVEDVIARTSGTIVRVVDEERSAISRSSQKELQGGSSLADLPTVIGLLLDALIGNVKQSGNDKLQPIYERIAQAQVRWGSQVSIACESPAGEEATSRLERHLDVSKATEYLALLRAAMARIIVAIRSHLRRRKIEPHWMFAIDDILAKASNQIVHGCHNAIFAGYGEEDTGDEDLSSPMEDGPLAEAGRKRSNTSLATHSPIVVSGKRKTTMAPGLSKSKHPEGLRHLRKAASLRAPPKGRSQRPASLSLSMDPGEGSQDPLSSSVGARMMGQHHGTIGHMPQQRTLEVLGSRFPSLGGSIGKTVGTSSGTRYSTSDGMRATSQGRRVQSDDADYVDYHANFAAGVLRRHRSLRKPHRTSQKSLSGSNHGSVGKSLPGGVLSGGEGTPGSSINDPDYSGASDIVPAVAKSHLGLSSAHSISDIPSLGPIVPERRESIGHTGSAAGNSWGGDALSSSSAGNSHARLTPRRSIRLSLRHNIARGQRSMSISQGAVDSLENITLGPGAGADRTSTGSINTSRGTPSNDKLAVSENSGLQRSLSSDKKRNRPNVGTVNLRHRTAASQETGIVKQRHEYVNYDNLQADQAAPASMQQGGSSIPAPPVPPRSSSLKPMPMPQGSTGNTYVNWYAEQQEEQQQAPVTQPPLAKSLSPVREVQTPAVGSGHTDSDAGNHSNVMVTSAPRAAGLRAGSSMSSSTLPREFSTEEALESESPSVDEFDRNPYDFGRISTAGSSLASSRPGGTGPRRGRLGSSSSAGADSDTAAGMSVSQPPTPGPGPSNSSGPRGGGAAMRREGSKRRKGGLRNARDVHNEVIVHEPQNPDDPPYMKWMGKVCLVAGTQESAKATNGASPASGSRNGVMTAATADSKDERRGDSSSSTAAAAVAMDPDRSVLYVPADVLSLFKQGTGTTRVIMRSFDELEDL
eukprot:Clim_evm1s177 gene=Clim_evmTU1s177